MQILDKIQFIHREVLKNGKAWGACFEIGSSILINFVLVILSFSPKGNVIF